MDPRFPTGEFVFIPNQTAAQRRECIAAIGSLPSELKAAMAGARLDKTYREGGWTARQVVHHLADSHMNAFIRFRLALTEDKPTIKPYDEAAWANLADTRDTAIETSLTLLTALHERWVGLLKSMAPSDFGRKLNHPEWEAPLSLDSMLALYAWHGPHHTAHITSLRKRMGW